MKVGAITGMGSVQWEAVLYNTLAFLIYSNALVLTDYARTSLESYNICGYLNASQSNNPPPLRFGAPPNKLPATQQQQPQMQQRKRQQVSK